MQRTLGVAVLAAASFLAPAIAMAQEANGPVQISTTADLARVCNAKPGPGYDYQRGICDGFIGGSGSLYVRLVENKVVANWSCAPANSSLDDARRVFVTWAQANPQYATETATDGLWRAFNATWPCPKADGPIVPAPGSIVKHKTAKP